MERLLLVPLLLLLPLLLRSAQHVSVGVTNWVRHPAKKADLVTYHVTCRMTL
jgi:hypothetical protein